MAHTSHVGISERDLDRSVAFYTTYFDFTVLKTFEKEIFQIKGAALEREDIDMEILQPYNPAPKPKVAGPLANYLRPLGANHIALGVPDLPALYERMKTDGVPLITEVMDGRTFFCADPDGTPIEVRKM